MKRSRMVNSSKVAKGQKGKLSTRAQNRAATLISRMFTKCKSFIKEWPTWNDEGIHQPIDHLMFIMVHNLNVWMKESYSNHSILWESFYKFYGEVLRINSKYLSVDKELRKAFSLKPNDMITTFDSWKSSLLNLIADQSLADPIEDPENLAKCLSTCIWESNNLKYLTQVDCVRCGSFRKHHDCGQERSYLTIEGSMRNLDIKSPEYYDDCPKCHYSNTRHCIIWQNMPNFLIVSFKNHVAMEDSISLKKLATKLRFLYGKSYYRLHSLTFRSCSSTKKPLSTVINHELSEYT